jgi:hypothetical protein
MNQVRYYFDGKKISGSQANKEKFVKEVFQALFQNQTNEIFETIWQNARLRGDLFPRNPQITDDSVYKDLSKQAFIQWINTLDDKLFGFIKVK